MVGGVALLDYDNDGYLDVFVVNGAAIPSLQKESPKYWNRLYHNNHDGTFTDVTEAAGVAGIGYGMGVAVGDYDNDGWADIYVVNVGKNQLLHNNGNGTFTDVTDKAGLAEACSTARKCGPCRQPGWTTTMTGCSTCSSRITASGRSTRTHTADRLPNCALIAILRIMRTFRILCTAIMATAPSPTSPRKPESPSISGKGMGVAIADYDGDGFMDIFVANDNRPTSSFTILAARNSRKWLWKPGLLMRRAAARFPAWASISKTSIMMGVPDIWHTAVENESFPLFHNVGRGQFVEQTLPAQLAVTRTMSGWGNGIFDFDNDGWKDLFVARSNVLDNVAQFSNRKYEEPNSVLRNLGNGKFQDVSSDAGADFQVAGCTPWGCLRRYR